MLVEQDQVAGATTGLAAGLLSLGVQDPLERRLVKATIDGLEALAQKLDAPSPLNRPGSHVLARTPHETAHLEALARDLKALGEPTEALTPQAWVQQMQKRGLQAQSEGLESVLSIPGDAWALSTETTNLLVQGAKEHGTELRQATKVRSLVWKDQVATGLELANGERIQADHVILAMGAWTKPFLEQAGFRLPALAFTTHAAILSLSEAVDAPIIHDHPGHYYFRPESPTHLLVGNGTDTNPTDPNTFHNTPDPDFFRNIAKRITTRVPGLKQARLKTAWRGILTATPDRAALAGVHPEAEGLWVLTGDNGYGFMRGWALGAILAHKIDPASPLPPAIPEQALAHTDPGRFWPDPPESFPITEGFELAEDTPSPAGPTPAHLDH